MPERTKRDNVWITALHKCVREDKTVKPVEIASETGVSEAVVREVLLVMSGSGWLIRSTNKQTEVNYMANPQPFSEVAKRIPE